MTNLPAADAYLVDDKIVGEVEILSLDEMIDADIDMLGDTVTVTPLVCVYDFDYGRSTPEDGLRDNLRTAAELLGTGAVGTYDVDSYDPDDPDTFDLLHYAWFYTATSDLHDAGFIVDENADMGCVRIYRKEVS